MSKDLSDQKVAFLVAMVGVEQVELTEPWKAVEEAGGKPLLISETPGSIQGFNHLDKGDRFDVDVVITQVKIENYDALVLPGGVANPDLLRTIPDVVQVVGQFFANRKPVAAICHAPWTLVEADAVRGRSLTSWPSLQTDIRNAGGTWVDERVVVNGNLITSRKPDDLPAFIAALLEAVNHGADSAEAAEA